MAQYEGMVLTKAGIDMLAKAQLGVNFIITKVAIGDGYLAEGEKADELTDLKSLKLNLAVQDSKFMDNGEIKLRAIITNENLSTGFFVREIGVFAKLEGEEEQEQLYSYTNAGQLADFLPAKGVNIVEDIVDIYSIVGSTQNIVVNIDDRITLATKDDVTKTVDEHDKSETAHEPLHTIITNEMKAYVDNKQVDTEALAKSVKFYVDMHSQQVNQDGTEAYPYKSIQEAVNAIPTFCKIAEIIVKRGTYNEDVRCVQKVHISIKAQGEDVVNVKSFSFEHSMFANVENITITGLSSSNISVNFAGCTFGSVLSCKLNLGGVQKGFAVNVLGTPVNISGCTFNNYNNCVVTDNAGSARVFGNTFTNCIEALSASAGTIYSYGNTFEGVTREKNHVSGVVLDNEISEKITTGEIGGEVGDVYYRPFLKKGHVKANGATVNRADYPKLVKFATDNGLWTTTESNAAEPWKYGLGDGSTTMVLPDYRNRALWGGDNAGVLSAGLPNITGTFGTNPYRIGGAFYRGGGGGGYGEHHGDYACTAFSASKSNAIYGSSSTVQPPSIVLIPQIKF